MSDETKSQAMVDAEILAQLEDPRVYRLIRPPMGTHRHWEYFDYTGYPDSCGWRFAGSLREAVQKLVPTRNSWPPHVR